MEQVRIDFLVTGNMSSLTGQVQGLNAQLMQSAASATALGRSFNNMDVQSANRQFANLLTNSNQFDARMVSMRSNVDSFADGLNRARLSGRQYFTESINYMRRQSSAISELAKQQVRMQNSVMQPLGRDASGRMMANVFTPTGLADDTATKLRTANKAWEIFNHTAQQGANSMINWGKNTQWAGRQLMVGFTVPMAMLGGLAAKTFKDLDEELVRLQKVYGSGLTFGDDFTEQAMQIRASAIDMAKELAAAYGVAATDTAGLMADLASAGYEGQQLMDLTRDTTKLSVLGEVDRQEAMKATVALQTAFGHSTKEVSDDVLFLNAVENQTSATLGDMVEAIPRAGTVIKGLGGDVQDLAMYMVAMREGGISAAEGANALKSGLSSIISPAASAVDFMKEFGINLPKLVQQNQGDLTGTLMAFQEELQGLDDLARQQVITKLFGKYQFARMNALFNNLGAQGSQTQKVLELMGYSMEELGQIADQEIGQKAQSVSGQWNRAWESFKVNIADVGETMLKWGTKLLGMFNSLFGFLDDHEWAMNLVKYGGLALAVIGPIVMTMGLLGNMFGMLTKGVLRLINAGKTMSSGGGIASSFKMLTAETFAADSALEKYNTNLFDADKAMAVVEQAVLELQAAYEGLGVSVVETGSQMVGAMERVEAASVAAASWAPGTSANPRWKANGIPMDRSHFIPRNIQDPQMQAMANQIFGVTPGMTPQGSKETFNFGKYGWGFTSLDANKTAGSQMPFFAQARPTANAQQMKSAYDINKWMEIQEKLLIEDGVTQEKINAWKTKTLQDAQAAAGNTKDIYAAERSYMVAMRRLADLAGVKITTMTEGGNYTSAARDRARIITQPGGIEDSPAMFDIMDTQGRAAAMELVGSTTAIASQLDLARVQVDAAFQNLGIKMTPAAQELAAVMAQTAAEVGAVNFAEIEMAGKRYVAVLDANGKVISSTARMVTANDQVRKMNTAQMEAFTVGLAKDTTQVKTHTVAVEADTVAERANTTAVNADTIAEKANTAVVNADTVAEGANTKASLMSRMGGGKGMGLMMGATMLPMMIPTGDNAAANTAMNAVTGAGMGAMVGSMIAPGIGTAIGAALGGAVPLATAAFGAMQRASDERAAEAAATWEAEFGRIDISSELASQLDLSLDVFKMPQVDLSGFGQPIKSATAEYTAAVTEGMATQIEQIKTMTDDEAIGFGQRMFSNIVAGGGDPADAMRLIRELMSQAEKELAGFQISASVDINLDEKEAQRQVAYAIKAVAANSASEFGNIVSESLTADKLNELASQSADAYFNALQEAFDTGAIDSDQYFTRTMKGVEDIRDAMNQKFRNSDFMQVVKETPGALGYLRRQTGLTGNSIKELQASFNNLNSTEQADFFTQFADSGNISNEWTMEQNQAMSQLGKTIYQGGQEQAAYLAKVRESNPEIAGLANRLMELDKVESIERATLMALRIARQKYNEELRRSAMLTDFAAKASKFLSAAHQQEAVNIEKLERQQSREIENLQESESDRLENLQESEADRLEALQEGEADRIEAMQEAADKRERLMQREIDQVTNQYDKEIAQIQRAEDKRQEAFQAEEDRFQRRQEMRNLEISYDEAVANGELYEAARIRMDISGISQQRQRADAEERRQNRTERRIRAIEKEKNAKVRSLEKALRQEQRANEKMIESAQEASDAKIEAAQDASEAMIEAAQEASDKSIEAAEKANRLEVKAAKAKNREIAKDEQDAVATSEHLFDLLVRGRLGQFKQEAKELGINAKERSALIAEFVSDQFKKLPPAILKSLTDGIRQDDWSILQKLVKGSIEGMSQKELHDLAGWQAQYNRGGNPATRGTAGSGNIGMATGGYVSGPGTSRSDSINARLSNGEYVVQASQVAKYGKSFFDNLNGGHNVGRPGKGGYGFASGGIVDPIIRSGLLKPVGDSLGKMLNSLTQSVGSDSFGGLKGAASGDIVMWDGEPLDALVAAQLRLAGKLLGHRYTVYQGSYQPQTSYSGTTHTDGGVADTQGSGVYSQDVIDLQKAGFAAWYRGPGAPGAAANYPPHVHAVSLLSRNLDTAAAYQRSHYLDMSGDGISGPYYGPHVQPLKNLRAKLPGLQVGTEFVKYDNTLANLHKGESVLTAPLTKAFKDNVAGGAGDVYDIDITGPFYKEFDVTAAVKKGILEAKREEANRNRGGRKN